MAQTQPPLPPPPYTYAPTLSFPMTTTTALSTSLPPSSSSNNAHQQTLPLLQPMDLAQYNIYQTPLLPHNSLPISNDRFHTSPSSSPYSGSPQVGHNYPINLHQTPSTFSSPGMTPWTTHTRSYSDSSMLFAPSPMAAHPGIPFTNAGTRLREVINDPQGVQGVNKISAGAGGEWRSVPVEYPYAQPFAGWEVAMEDPQVAEEEDLGEEGGKKTLQRARRHVCPVCDKRFNRPSSLNTHMTVHTGAKPFQCSKLGCGRAFSVSSNLRRHEKTHEARRSKQRAQSDDINLDIQSTSPDQTQSTSSHPPSHSHSHTISTDSSFSFPYPISHTQHLPQPFLQPHFHNPQHGYTHTYDPIPALDYATAPTAASMTLPAIQTGLSLTPLPTSLASVRSSISGFETLGGTGLDQYSIMRRSSSTSGTGTGGSGGTGTGGGSRGSVSNSVGGRSPLEGFGGLFDKAIEKKVFE